MLVADPANDVSDNAPLFCPPLWIQRRALVSQLLKSNDVHSVLDLGCGEGSLLEILLNDATFTRLAGVDIDQHVLDMAACNCSPTDYDKQYLRELPVDFNLYQGSAAQVDKRLSNFDAITSVEVIEHLDAEVLDAFPGATLGAYKPRLMIVTTPNAEFNVNFPNLKYGTDEASFRHWDHRFEWTREQFQKWARSAASKYNYSVHFGGVGTLASSGNQSVGYCTQLAVFQRIDDQPKEISPIGLEHSGNDLEGPYTHHINIEFPYFTETGFTDGDIVREVKDRTSCLLWNDWHARKADAKANGNSDVPWPSIGSASLLTEQYWNILRIRHLCKTKSRLIEVLASPAAQDSFALVEDCQRVQILFEVPQEDDTYSSAEDPNDGDDGNWDLNPYSEYGVNDGEWGVATEAANGQEIGVVDSRWGTPTSSDKTWAGWGSPPPSLTKPRLDSPGW